VRPVIQDLVCEIKTGLEAFEQTHPGRRVQRVLVLGGGCRLHGLLRCLWWGDQGSVEQRPTDLASTRIDKPS
jgi:Tfp pilus assembly PilM family ATPase